MRSLSTLSELKIRDYAGDRSLDDVLSLGVLGLLCRRLDVLRHHRP